MTTLETLLNQPASLAHLALSDRSDLYFVVEGLTPDTATSCFYDLHVALPANKFVRIGDVVHVSGRLDGTRLTPDVFEINPPPINQAVDIAGRVMQLREQKNRIFLDVRAGMNTLPVIVEGGCMVGAKNLLVGQMVELRGILTPRFGKIRTHVPVELHLRDNVGHINNYGTREDQHSTLCVTGDIGPTIGAMFSTVGPEIALRHEYLQRIARIGHSILTYFDSHFSRRGFTQFQSSLLLEGDAEGGARPFQLEGYDLQLAQSPQLQKEIIAIAMGNVYTIMTAFRNDPSTTRVHLPEFTSLDVEMAFHDLARDPMTGVMDELEGLVTGLYTHISTANAADIAALALRLPSKQQPMPRITFEEGRQIIADRVRSALENATDRHNSLHQIIQELGTQGNVDHATLLAHVWGEDSKNLSPKGEKELIEYAREKTGFPGIFVTNFPLETKPFYAQPDKDGGSRSFDLLLGHREIASGGERVSRIDILDRQLMARGLLDDHGKVPKSLSKYYAAIRAGAPRHGGFGVGFDRLLFMILDGQVHARYLRPFAPYPASAYLHQT